MEVGRRSAARVKRTRAVASPAVPLLEFDAGRLAIIEPSEVFEPIEIAEHCVLCFFPEVIRELVREGAK